MRGAYHRRLMRLGDLRPSPSAHFEIDRGYCDTSQMHLGKPPFYHVATPEIGAELVGRRQEWVFRPGLLSLPV